MRDYKQVVEERYELDDFSGKGIENNIYSCINNIGNYGFHKEAEIIRYFIKIIMRETHKRLDEILILDCGCGNGLATRLVSEFLGNAQSVYGFEYSKNRLQYCKDMNSSISYEWGDVVNYIPYDGMKFHGIMAIDVLQHLRKKEDVISALRNIYSFLYEKGGVFMWYDINEKTHYDDPDDDSQGFSALEMDEYAKEVGFEKIESIKLYKSGRIPVIKKNISTYYLASNMNHTLLDFLNIILPFPNLINVHIYRKI